MEELFKELINKLEKEIPREEFQRWISPIKYRFGGEKNLLIQVPNIFFKNWLREKFLSLMYRTLGDLTSRKIDIQFVCGPVDRSVATAPSQESPNQYQAKPALDDHLQINSFLNEKYSFSNFVVGASNQLAHAASQAVAYRSAAYNPLFIYGGSGLGKTHLLNAIGNHLINQDRTLKVVYLSSEDFTNELIEALRNERMNIFRQKYRNIDTLLIDDIHFIGGRERTQEEFFYTFNSLYEADKHIVLSSDKMPKEIPDLEDRLRSRFEGGLFADITPPDRETKVAILCKKAEEEGIELNNQVAFYLASQNENNIRVLEGYLARLAAYSSLTNTPINLESAQKLLGLFIASEQKKVNLDTILRATADFFSLKTSDLKSNKKQKAIAIPRQSAMYIARKMTSLSTIEIGQRFGGRDHSTVIHAVKKVESRMESDPSFSRTISELQKYINEQAV